MSKLDSRPEDYVIQIIAKRIAGDIVYADQPGRALRKWREYFRASQSDVAKNMNVAVSVISEYEKGRRQPGARFIRRFINALLAIDAERGWPRVLELSRSLGLPPGVVLDMREFETPLSIDEIVSLVKGVVLSLEIPVDRKVYGYTVVDSIRAISTLSGTQFYMLLGLTSERALIFTGVRLGRSPMVAVRVSPVKPSLVIIHGPRENVDPLAIELARLDRVPLVLSLARGVDELIKSLRRSTQEANIAFYSV
ncbi:helix-turn-helix domain-containing protein [Stetteria hydrogenophila]